MGQTTPTEAPVQCWAQLCADPHRHSLAGKVELTGSGAIEVFPAGNRQAIRRSAVGLAIAGQTDAGTGVFGCSILATGGDGHVFDATGLQPHTRFSVAL
jgi:hypothetical protein